MGGGGLENGLESPPTTATQFSPPPSDSLRVSFGVVYFCSAGPRRIKPPPPVHCPGGGAPAHVAPPPPLRPPQPPQGLQLQRAAPQSQARGICHCGGAGWCSGGRRHSQRRHRHRVISEETDVSLGVQGT